MKPKPVITITGVYHRAPWQVYMAIAHQSFKVGPDWPTRVQAVWFARQLRIALKKLVGTPSKRKAKP